MIPITLLPFFFSLALSSTEKGTIVRPQNNYIVLGTFCFPADPVDFVGQIASSFTAQTKDYSLLQDLNLLFYNDAQNSYGAVYGKDLNCSEWERAAINWNDGQDAIDVSYQINWENESGRLSWNASPYLTQVHPRFWYVAIDSCHQSNSTMLPNIDYEIHFINLKNGNQEAASSECNCTLEWTKTLAQCNQSAKNNVIKIALSVFFGLLFIILIGVLYYKRDKIQLYFSRRKEERDEQQTSDPVRDGYMEVN